MPTLYNIADIELGDPTYSGHEVYLDAVHTPPHSKASPSKVIFKKNKHGHARFSSFEVAFSQLARLFLSKGLTCPQTLVVDDNQKVVGLVTEHLCYVIKEKEGLKSYYTFDNPELNCNCTGKIVSQAEAIPYYFFDKLPQGFFARLLKAEEDGILNVDYDSLASILATSYTLEEDDLHKGNFGFYLVEKNGKPQAVFFKIDHDLMFVDSIMSFKASRPFHILSKGDAFDIDAEDLSGFPILKKSSNSYWPTKIGYISKPWDNKEYHNFAEVEAFALLAKNSRFKKATWKAFYKHILESQEMIENCLKDCLNQSNARDRAQIALMTQATIARQARLKTVLFSIPKFRDFISNMTEDDRQSLLSDLLGTSKETDIPAKVRSDMSFYHQLCKSELGIGEGDTPLHIAIKLGDYRYEETIQMFGHFINTKNSAGKTPWDIALERLEISEAHPKDIRKDLRFTMRHLLENGAEVPNSTFKTEIESYKFKTPYINKVIQANTYQQLKNILRDVGEDHSYCLKSQKNLAIDCIARFIKSNCDNPSLKGILIQLRKDINGESKSAESADVKYIRQLRSRLWIIRQIRGLYGYTSTQGEINEIIDKELNRLDFQPRALPFFSEPRGKEIIHDVDLDNHIPTGLKVN